MKARINPLFIVATLSLAGITFTQAADQYWNPSPLSGNWANSVWSATSGGGSLTTWSASNNAIFDQIGTYTATIDAAQTATNINIKAGTVTFAGTNTVSSTAITIDSGATLNTVGDRIAKAGTTSVTVNGTLDLTAGGFNGGRYIQLGGSGTVIGGFRHSGTASFSGNIEDVSPTVRAGILWNGGTGGTLTLSGNNSGMSGDVLMSLANSVIKLNSANAFSANSHLRFSGTTNSNLIELAAADFTRAWFTGSAAEGKGGISWTGTNAGFYATGGDRNLTFVTTTGGSTAASVVWGSNGLTSSTVVLGAAASTHKITWTNDINLNAVTRTINTANGSAAIEAEISGALSNGTLLATGTGTLKLSGNNSLTTINKGAAGTDTGTLILSGNNTFSNATLTYGTASENRGAIRLEHNSALGGVTVIAGNSGTLGAQARIELSNNITVTGIELRGGGRSNSQTTGATLVNISGDNTWAGAVRIYNSGGGHGIRSDAGTLTISGGVNSNIGARTWEIGGAGNVTITGDVTTAVGITKFGAGILTLSGSGNTYTGDTKPTAGSLVINHANALSGSTLDLATGDTGEVSFGTTITASTLGSLKGSRNLSLNNTAVVPAAVTLTVGVNNAGTNTFTGLLSGSGHLYKSGTGIQILDPGSAASISIGALSANGGNLILKSGTFATTGKDPLGSLAAYNIGAGARGGTLTIDGATLNVGGGNNLKIAATTGGSLNILSGTVTSNDLVIGHNGSGVATQSGGSVTVTNLFHQDAGSGSAGSSYTLTGGSLTARRIHNNTSSTAATAEFTLNLDGGTLKSAIGTTNLIDNQNIGTQIAVLLGTGDTIIDTTASNASIVRPMGDMPSVAGAFTKAGTNTLTLTEANTYTGATTINGGTLTLSATGSIDNSSQIIVGDTGSSGAVLDVSAKTGGFTVSSTQTLSGIGTVDADDAGTLRTVTIAGTHAVGNSPGSQTVDGNLAYASGSIFEWDLAANKDTDGLDDSIGATADNGVAGTDYDAVTVTGTLNIASDAVFKVIQNAGADFSDAFWTSNQNWSNIFNVTGSVTSGWSNTLVSVYNTSNALQDVSTYGSFTVTGSTLTWTAVPEPTSALAGILLGFGLLRRRR